MDVTKTRSGGTTTGRGRGKPAASRMNLRHLRQERKRGDTFGARNPKNANCCGGGGRRGVGSNRRRKRTPTTNLARKRGGSGIRGSWENSGGEERRNGLSEHLSFPRPPPLLPHHKVEGGERLWHDRRSFYLLTALPRCVFPCYMRAV